ncbi:MAG TPA: S9 family peptidase [Planctomycetaceae bacterium]|nr:S9 family peptidase [Planctomycetaceae bacterium]
MRILLQFLCICLLSSSFVGAQQPKTKKQPVSDDYHGVSVREDYRWLEDWSDPQVRAWSASQNKFARSILDDLESAGPLRKQVTKILGAATTSYRDLVYRGKRFFAIKRQPPKEQPFIVVFDALDNPDAARVLVDPTKIDAAGTTAIDWFKVSPDGRYVAVSLSRGGSETGNLSVYDVGSGRQVFENIAHVNSGTAGGSLAWTPDSQSFFYTKHLPVRPDDPADHNVYQHVYLHRLGTAADTDRYELGKGFPQIAEIQLVTDDRSGRVLATVQEGDGGEFAHYLRETDGTWRQFSRFGDGTKQAVFGNEDDLFVVTLRDAPRGRIVQLPIRGELNVSQAATLIQQSDETIVSSGIAFWGETTVLPTATRLYVVYQQGGPSVIRAFHYNGEKAAAPRQLPVSAVHGLLHVHDDTILFGNTSFTQPDGYYRYDGEQTKKTAIASSSPVDLSDVTVVRKFATSKDGTRVPLNILMPAGVQLDGNNPCIVYGYGGYGVNIEPSFNPLRRVLMDRKVIYVVANIRGGGEFGEQWHRQGNLTNKQNVFDDFAACVNYMIRNRYTSPQKTGILGGSNGGLLMGATLTQHPAMIKCAVALVGIYDMLRVELSPNGAFNVTEFGTVKDPAQFRALYAYSPLHHVQDGIKYPAVLFVTGENDPRVDPMQSRKMTARLQAATASGNPVLLRTSANAGHGGDNSLSERIEQSVDIYAFFFHQLGVKTSR